MVPLWIMPADLPTEGDEVDSDLQAALGRVIVSWGEIEAQLCVAYCVFVGRLFDRETVLEFGAGRIFAERAILVETQAAKYFVREPHQEHEADFSEIIGLARGFAALRNDVAHTVMRPWNWVSEYLPNDPVAQHAKSGWCLLPMYFDPKRFKDARPQYVLTSKRLDGLATALHHFGQDVAKYRYDWWEVNGTPRPKRFEPNP